MIATNIDGSAAGGGNQLLWRHQDTAGKRRT